MALDLRAPLGSEHDLGPIGIAGKSSIASGSHSNQTLLDATDSKQSPNIVPFGEDYSMSFSFRLGLLAWDGDRWGGVGIPVLLLGGWMDLEPGGLGGG